jgi:UDP-3-O-[3-hydroxymyristoyl] N-acetylglucosamine deacetylase
MPFGGWQGTVAFPVRFTGTGVHCNQQVEVTVLPAPVDHGIVFDCIFAGGIRIPVKPENVMSTGGCTELAYQSVTLRTIEHFLAACLAVGIDNALVRVSAAEMPILDGSALPIVLKLKEAKLQQTGIKQYYQLNHPIVVRHGKSYIEARPSSALKISCEIDFDHPWFLRHHESLKMDLTINDQNLDHVIQARTFGFVKDLSGLLKRNLAQGASLKNSVLFDYQTIINAEGLRFEKEPVAHKFLDLLGDLAVLGKPILADIKAYCPGHKINIELVNRLIEGDLLVCHSKTPDKTVNRASEVAWVFE